MEINIDHTKSAMSGMADEAQRFYDIMNNNTGIILKAAGELAEYQARLTDAQNQLSVYSQKVNQLAKDLETQKTINTQLQATVSNLKRQNDDLKNGRGGGGRGGQSAREIEEAALGIAKNIHTYGS